MKQKKNTERVKYYLAIDIGASSGRHVVGYERDGGLVTDLVYSFGGFIGNDGENPVLQVEGLFEEVIAGLSAAFSKYPEIESISVDGVGSDYVLLSEEGEEILPVYTSRDVRAAEVIDEVRELADAKAVYEHTGVQLSKSSSLCHLYADKEWGRLDGAADFLMIPEYIAYKLTGNKRKEFTVGTSTGLVNNDTGRYDRKIWSSLGLPIALDAALSPSGTPVGKLKPEVVKRVGGESDVVLCVADRIASAVAALGESDNAPYVFLGEPSVIGVKAQSVIKDDKSFDFEFSNFGGDGFNRYQKNVFGIGMIESLKRELCPDATEADITAMAEESGYFEILDVNDSAFFAPHDMKEAIDAYMVKNKKSAPKDARDYFKCVYMSMGYCFGVSVANLEYNTGRAYGKLYMLGAGESSYLKRIIEKYTGKKIVELSEELSAIGNIKTQIRRG